MRVILIILALFSTTAFAESVKDKIKDYKANIESTQQKIASVLVMQNFSRFFVESLDQNAVAKQFAYFASDHGQYSVDRASKALFESIYSEKLNQEKIDDIVTLLVLMRRGKLQWVGMGADLQSSHTSFIASFTENTDICSEDRFAQSLAVLQQYAPEGIDTSELARSWELRVGGTLSQGNDGSAEFGYYGSLKYETDSDSEEVRHAVSTTAGAIASIYLTPAGGVAVAMAIEVLWGAVEMGQHIREMEAIAEANEDLYESMRFEINVRKHYNNYCSSLKRAYLEAKPLVINVKSELGRRQLTEEVERLGQLLGSGSQKFSPGDSLISEEPEQFFLYFKHGILSEAKILDQYSRNYYAAWNERLNRLDGFMNNLEKALIQLVQVKVEAEFKPNERVLTLIARVETLANLKTAFYELFLKFYATVELSQGDILRELRGLVYDYEVMHPSLSVEETAFLAKAWEVIETLENSDE